jgi:hypothetical protein
MLLKKGDHNANVRLWQSFLDRDGFSCKADDFFGLATELVTKAFQRSAGLKDDGIVGDGTIAAAMKKGFAGFSSAAMADHAVASVITTKPLVVPADSHTSIFAVSDRVTQINQAIFAKLAGPVQARCNRFVAAAAADGVGLQAVQGLRTFSYQDGLYAQGRTKPGRIVTNARGGQSLHNYGVACDFAVLDSTGKIAVDAHGEWSSPHYDDFGAWARIAGLEWGGSWHTLKDRPHVQFTNGMTLGQIQALYRQGGIAEVWKHLGN